MQPGTVPVLLVPMRKVDAIPAKLLCKRLTVTADNGIESAPITPNLVSTGLSSGREPHDLPQTVSRISPRAVVWRLRGFWYKVGISVLTLYHSLYLHSEGAIDPFPTVFLCCRLRAVLFKLPAAVDFITNSSAHILDAST